MTSINKARPLRLIISAPSGGGKTSLIRSLLDRDNNIRPICSHTTRGRKMSEKNGKDYWFVDRPTFRNMIDNGDLIEHNENYGQLYGTSIMEVKKAANDGRDLLFEVDWNGAQAIRKIISKSVWIFLIPPNIQSLKRRLRSRGRDSSEEIELRLDNALNEIRQGIEKADYIVNNDHFDSALEQVRSIIVAERCRRDSARWRIRDIINSLFEGETEHVHPDNNEDSSSG